MIQPHYVIHRSTMYGFEEGVNSVISQNSDLPMNRWADRRNRRIRWIQILN